MAATKRRNAGKALRRIQAEQRQGAYRAWARRHPERAAEERALEKRNARVADDWSHKHHGTAATHEHATRQRRGALARLHASGAISIEQLGWALEIASVAEAIGMDVSVRTMSLETRVDQSRSGDGGFFESLGRVRREVAYTRWREALPRIAGGGSIAPILAMVIEDIGVTVAAKRWRMHNRRAKKILLDALDLWPSLLGDARRDIDEATLLAAHAGIL